ncbi:MAG: NAD-dependent epimerase/dehydratase family protein [Ilumatobacteraceae bacterium]
MNSQPHARPASAAAEASGAGYAGAVCVVTGGLGFIGSNLALALSHAGAQVRVVDALVPQHGGDRRNVVEFGADGGADVEITIADIADAAAVTPLVADADFVFNIAGQVSHQESMIDPMRDLDINVSAQLRLLETLRHVRPAAVVVHTSTRQVYGRPQYLPVDEAHPTVPRDINGVDKLAGEQYHRLYGEVHGLRTVALRLTNVYGPRQNLQKQGLGFLPVFIRRVLRGEGLGVFGDGQQLRDCLHVHDVVTALELAGIAALSGRVAPGSVFNLGGDESHTLLAIAELCAAVAGTGSVVELLPWPDELSRIDIGGFQTDSRAAALALGWSPTIPLADGIESTLNFFREHPWYL